MLQLKRTRLNGAYEKWVSEYWDVRVPQRADLVYLHGGGLLFGTREDLPTYHLERLTQEGFRVLALDYPLAPNAKLPQILTDILLTMEAVVRRPYVLLGRSSGAYLSLLTAASGKLWKNPVGLVSYYGYGFLTDGWYDTPNDYYASFPAVDSSSLPTPSDRWYAAGSLAAYYPLYVYARQHGCWRRLFFDGSGTDFIRTATLRQTQRLPCPAFFAHSMHDPDVPFAESQQLAEQFRGRLFVATGQRHEFDLDTESAQVRRLLDQTLKFLYDCL